MRGGIKVKINPRIKDLDKKVKLSKQDQKLLQKVYDEAISAEYQKTFQSQGRTTGQAWAPLSPKYKERKAKAGLSTRILEATGQMKEAFTNPSAAGHASGSKRVGNNLVEFFTTVTGRAAELAGYHETGNSRLPKREIQKFSERGEARIKHRVKGYLRNLYLRGKRWL